MIEQLQHAFAGTVDSAVRALAELQTELRDLGATAEELRKTVLTLQVAQVNGVVEATRFEDDDSFAVMFADLREGIEGTKQALVDVNDISERLHAMADNTPAMAAIISAAVEQMRRDVQTLSAVAGMGSGEAGGVVDRASESEQPAA
jgi:aerotaxis receptor